MILSGVRPNVVPEIFGGGGCSQNLYTFKGGVCIWTTTCESVSMRQRDYFQEIRSLNSFCIQSDLPDGFSCSQNLASPCFKHRRINTHTIHSHVSQHTASKESTASGVLLLSVGVNSDHRLPSEVGLRR